MGKPLSLLMALVCLLVSSCGTENLIPLDSPATLSFDSNDSPSARSTVIGAPPALDADVQTLDKYYQFVFTGNLFTNWAGLREVWFWSHTLKGWVYLLPSGDLHQWVRGSHPPRSQLLIAKGLGSYLSNPMGIIEPSALTCGPNAIKVAGGCWYYAGTGDNSCTAACANHGGYNDLTRTYAGAKFAGDTSNTANCQALVAQFNKRPVDPLYPPLTSQTPGVGCTAFGRALLNTSAPTTAAATPNFRQHLAYRICACNR